MKKKIANYISFLLMCFSFITLVFAKVDVVDNGYMIQRLASVSSPKITSVTSKDETELIKISVTDENPETAYKVATEITKVFSEEVESIYNINNVHIVDQAELPSSPSNDNKFKDLVIFAAIGLAIAFGYIFLRNALDTTVKDEDEIEKICSSHVLAMIPTYDTKMIKGGRR